MKILVVAIGTAGDVYPFIGIARRLMQRGHQVRLASTERHRSFIEAAGLAFHVVPGVPGAAGSPDFYHPTRAMRIIADRMLIPAIKPVYELVSALDPEAWTVLADPFCYGARIARERAGAPLTTCLVSPYGLRSLLAMPVTPGFALPARAPMILRRAFFGMVERLWDHVLSPPLNAFRKDLGMPPVSDIWYGWSLSHDRVIGLFPEWFAPRPADWPPQFLYGGFTVYDQWASQQVPSELQKPGDPIVVFSAGSAGPAATTFFDMAVAASSGHPWRAVLLGGDSDHLTRPVPANVFPFRYIPMSRLLPLSSVVVHHGGLGTISLALASGVPQIVIPFGHDQYDNAARLKRLGVGWAITKKSNLASRLAVDIERALGNESLMARCREFTSKAQPEPALVTICEQIEKDGERRASVNPT